MTDPPHVTEQYDGNCAVATSSLTAQAQYSDYHCYRANLSGALFRSLLLKSSAFLHTKLITLSNYVLYWLIAF